MLNLQRRQVSRTCSATLPSHQREDRGPIFGRKRSSALRSVHSHDPRTAREAGPSPPPAAEVGCDAAWICTSAARIAAPFRNVQLVREREILSRRQRPATLSDASPRSQARKSKCPPRPGNMSCARSRWHGTRRCRGGMGAAGAAKHVHARCRRCAYAAIARRGGGDGGGGGGRVRERKFSIGELVEPGERRGTAAARSAITNPAATRRAQS